MNRRLKCSLARSVLFFAAVAATVPAFAGENDTWLEYRKANGLSVEGTPSNPPSNYPLLLEMSLTDGNADRQKLFGGLRNAGTGTGDGTGGDMAPPEKCDSALRTELARSDGDPQGENNGCER